MTRIFGVLFAALYVASSASAIPVEPRQLGGIACNVARLKTVAGLRQATTAVNKLVNSNDPAAASAATTAQGGLQDASAGIKTIAGALLTGQGAPAAARDQVQQGLTTADTALGNITSTDSTITSMVDDAKTKVQNTISAGQDVVSQCGGGGGGSAAATAGTDANAGSGTAANNSTTSGTGGSDATADNGDNSGTSGSDTTTSNGNNNATDGSDNNGNNNFGGSDNNSGNDGTDGSNTTDVNNGNDGIDGSGAVGSNDGVDSSSNNNDGAADISLPANFRNSRLFGRQIGGIGCNVARAQTVGRLAQSAAAVRAVKSAAASDATSAAAANQATTALNSAKAGIAQIAVALIAGQKAPAAARDQVQTGLNDAMTALTGINSTDPNVTSAVTAAQSKVSSTMQAGQDVVSKC